MRAFLASVEVARICKTRTQAPSHYASLPRSSPTLAYSNNRAEQYCYDGRNINVLGEAPAVTVHGIECFGADEEVPRLLEKTPTRPVYDARYLGSVKVEYPLQRYFRQELRVIRRTRLGGTAFLELDLAGEKVFMAEWMTRSEECHHLTCGYDPACSWDALQALRRLMGD